VPEDLCSCTDDPYVPQPQRGDRLAHEPALLLHRIHGDHLETRSSNSKDQTGNPGARADVHDSPGSVKRVEVEEGKGIEKVIELDLARIANSGHIAAGAEEKVAKVGQTLEGLLVKPPRNVAGSFGEMQLRSPISRAFSRCPRPGRLTGHVLVIVGDGEPCLGLDVGRRSTKPVQMNQENRNVGRRDARNTGRLA
jgi:hypothetical protein